jgi:hypothetical protein
MLYEIQHKLFDITIYSIYFLIIIAYLGLSDNSTEYIDTLNLYLKIYVCFYLIYRFNPLTRNKFTELDRKIAFRSGLFILTTTFINQHVYKIGPMFRVLSLIE